MCPSGSWAGWFASRERCVHQISTHHPTFPIRAKWHAGREWHSTRKETHATGTTRKRKSDQRTRAARSATHTHTYAHTATYQAHAVEHPWGGLWCSIEVKRCADLHARRSHAAVQSWCCAHQDTIRGNKAQKLALDLKAAAAAGVLCESVALQRRDELEYGEARATHQPKQRCRRQRRGSMWTWSRTWMRWKGQC